MNTNRRRARWSLRVMAPTVVATLAVLGLVTPAQAVAQPAQSGSTQLVAAPKAQGSVNLDTTAGPITAMDEKLVQAVRLAGLWEQPAGAMAQEKGVNPRVREIGKLIADQHIALDAIVIESARKLNVELAEVPTDQQRRWLDEMADAEGEAFDEVFVRRLREAHGSVFAVIAVVRAATENDEVRALAQSANNFVLAHLTYLESTGLVPYAELPKVVAPATGPIAAAASRESSGGASVSLIWVVLAVALLAGSFGAARLIRPRNIGGHFEEAPYPGPRPRPGPAGPRPVPNGPRPVPPTGSRPLASVSAAPSAQYAAPEENPYPYPPPRRPRRNY